MKTNWQNGEREPRGGRYALRRGLGTWEVTFEGERDSFPDEQGAEYVVWLLLHPPPEPIHAVALVIEARHLRKHLLIPSGRGARLGRVRAATGLGGCFTCEPPPGVVWKRLRE